MLHCPKCLTSRSGGPEGFSDKLGDPCRTPGCDGVISVVPAFETLVDTLPEPMTCGRRFDTYPGGVPAHQDRGGGQDRWQRFKSNGNRVCSYCGSLHFEDMVALVKACADAPGDAPFGSVVEIERSDKAYKIYVRQPGVRNAMEGGIKFYMQHVPRDESGKLLVTDEHNDQLARAVKASKARFDVYLSQITKGAPPRPEPELKG